MTSDFEPLRLGLIGCGGMGQRHALAVAEMHEAGFRPVEIAAVCDNDASRRARLAAIVEAQQGYRPHDYACVAQLLDDPEVEAVDVVLPTSLHHTTVLAALAAGRHVLVEKPLALTVSACDLIVAAAARAGKVVTVAENYRRLPGNRALGSLIRDGAFGRFDAMSVRNFASPTPPTKPGSPAMEAPRWYLDRTSAGGYHVLEMGVHEADLQEFWFGSVESVTATTQVFERPLVEHPNASEDVLMATFRFAGGFVSQLAFASTMRDFSSADRMLVGAAATISSGAWHEWQKGFINCADGSVLSSESVVDDWLARLPARERAHLFPEGACRMRPDGSVATDPLSYGVGVAIHDFARAVRTGIAPEITPERARRAVAICCAMMESARSNASVSIDQILSGEIRAAQAALNEAIGVAA